MIGPPDCSAKLVLMKRRFLLSYREEVSSIQISVAEEFIEGTVDGVGTQISVSTITVAPMRPPYSAETLSVATSNCSTASTARFDGLHLVA